MVHLAKSSAQLLSQTLCCHLPCKAATPIPSASITTRQSSHSASKSQDAAGTLPTRLQLFPNLSRLKTTYHRGDVMLMCHAHILACMFSSSHWLMCRITFGCLQNFNNLASNLDPFNGMSHCKEMGGAVTCIMLLSRSCWRLHLALSASAWQMVDCMDAHQLQG